MILCDQEDEKSGLEMKSISELFCIGQLPKLARTTGESASRVYDSQDD